MSNFNVETASLQEAMDYAVMQIVAQGGQCKNEGDSCAYGNAKGHHCAVGWLLDAGNKELMTSGGTVHALVEEYADYVPDIIKSHTESFQRLQQFHDTDSSKWRAGALRGLESIDGIDTSAPHWQQWVVMGKA